MKTPKPTPRDVEREARRLERVRQLEPVSPRVVQLRPATRHQFDPAPDPKEAA